MKWITRERTKIDRIAYPWLIKKFVDKDAESYDQRKFDYIVKKYKIIKEHLDHTT